METVGQLRYFVNSNDLSKASFAKKKQTKNKNTSLYWIPVSTLIDFIVSKTLMNHPLDIFSNLELPPLDHTYSEIIIHGQNLDILD